MTDIVERLCTMSMSLCGGSLRQPEGSKIADEAAAEIERLRAALKEIAASPIGSKARELARRVLTE